MKALWFLWKRTKINKWKKALKKPGTYFYLLFMLAYFGWLGWTFAHADFGMEMSPTMMACTLTAFSFLMIPGNLVSYAKRKGLMFKNCDVHFMFPSPIKPKMILVYAYFQTLLAKMFFSVLIVIMGIFSFHVPVWRMILYAIFSLALQNTYEGCLAIIMYGSETMTEERRKVVRILSYCVIGALLVFLLLDYLKYGMGIELIQNYLTGAKVEMVPIVGWYVSMIHLLFMGPNTATLIGCALYVLSFIGLLIYAYKMPCYGGYYEDAIKFADDYEEAIAKQKKGQQVVVVGQKNKFKKAQIQWKGTGAKAIFYRQLLEYKKGRFYIFNMNMLICLAASIAIAFVSYTSPDEFGVMKPFIMPLIGAYIVFIFVSLNGKWAKELVSPFTYLIPDNAFRKLWYATLVPNLQNMISGALLVIPAGVVMGLSPLVMFLTVICYTIFAASKIYGHAVCEVAIGDSIGVFLRQMFEMLVVGLGVGFGVIGAFLGMYLSGEVLAYVIAIVFLLLYTSVFVVISTLNFYHLEK